MDRESNLKLSHCASWNYNLSFTTFWHLLINLLIDNVNSCRPLLQTHSKMFQSHFPIAKVYIFKLLQVPPTINKHEDVQFTISKTHSWEAGISECLTLVDFKWQFGPTGDLTCVSCGLGEQRVSAGTVGELFLAHCFALLSIVKLVSTDGRPASSEAWPFFWKVAWIKWMLQTVWMHCRLNEECHWPFWLECCARAQLKCLKQR